MLSFFKSRINFENKNRNDHYSRSFAEDGLSACVTFEFSSEGELEQLRPFMEHFLKMKRRIEVIFCSVSAEKNIEQMKKTYAPDYLRILRLPLLTNFSLAKWVTSSCLVLCRYDLFPQLLQLTKKQGMRSLLLSATLKSSWLGSRLYKKWAFRFFTKIVAANEVEAEALKMKDEDFLWCDARVLRIQQRLNQFKSEKIDFLDFLKLNDLYPRQKRWIAGNFWPNEAAIFSDDDFIQKIKKGELLFCIVPHRLEKEELEKSLELVLKEKDLPLYWIGTGNTFSYEDFFRRPGPIIIMVKGVLLELYQFFDLAFVGGGHGKSVHSVLEPFMAQCKILLGPKVGRSTEFDQVKKYLPEGQQIVEDLNDFYKKAITLSEVDLTLQHRSIINNFIEKNSSSFQWILDFLNR